MSKPVLYSYFRSSASWRVRTALAFKKIEYDYKPVSLIQDGGQQHTEEYQSLNSMRQVPTLVIDGLTLTQSLPIIEYLDETRPEHCSLVPKDAVARVQARRVAEIINSSIQPSQNLSIITMVAEWTGDPAKKAEWAKYWIDRGFVGLEKVLESTAGEYCVGDAVSIADLCLVPQVYNANRFKIDMSKFPIIQRVNDNCLKLKEFQAAEPHVQPDCPDDLKK